MPRPSPARLCLVLAEVPPPRRLRCRAAEQPADGLLRPGQIVARRHRARGGGARARRERQRLGQHAGGTQTARWRCASAFARSTASASEGGRSGVPGDPADWAERIVAARARRPFTSLEDFAREPACPSAALIRLAEADAMRSMGLDRREALWAVRRLPDDMPCRCSKRPRAEEPDETAAPCPPCRCPSRWWPTTRRSGCR